jgi:uncharacterized membrane protein
MIERFLTVWTITSVVLCLFVGLGSVPAVSLAHGDGTSSQSETVTDSAGDSTGSKPEVSRPKTDDGRSLGSSQRSSDSVARASGSVSSSTFLEGILPGFTGTSSIHPILVHFPIAFVIAAAVFLVFSWGMGSERLFVFGRRLFWLALVTLPIVLASGFWAAGGWGHEHVVGHRNWMVATTLLAYGVFGLGRLVSSRKRLYRVVLTVGIIIVAVCLTLGADRGAYLVHAEDAGAGSTHRHHGH